MSLINDYMDTCVILDEKTEEDGYGGYIINYVEGAKFNAAITFDNSIEAQIANKQGVTSLYKVTTSKALNLQYHKIFKRLSDEKIFRVTSDGNDNHTPKSAALDMRQVTAEEYTLPQT